MKKNKEFSKKILIKIGIAILIITPLVIGVWYVKSLIKSTTDTIVQSRKQFAERAASLNALVGLRDQYESFGKAYLNVLRNVIPIKDELINISKELESLAAKNDLGFGFSFKGEKDPSDGELGYIEYSLNISGDSINQIQSFIKDLDEFKYINTVDSLKLNRKNEEIEGNVEGRVYFKT